MLDSFRRIDIEVDGFETVIVKDLGLYKDKNGDICQVEEA